MLAKHSHCLLRIQSSGSESELRTTSKTLFSSRSRTWAPLSVCGTVRAIVSAALFRTHTFYERSNSFPNAITCFDDLLTTVDARADGAQSIFGALSIAGLHLLAALAEFDYLCVCAHHHHILARAIRMCIFIVTFSIRQFEGQCKLHASLFAAVCGWMLCSIECSLLAKILSERSSILHRRGFLFSRESESLWSRSRKKCGSFSAN